MINIQNANKFCCEDISLIENYDKAIADTTQVWDCHHRLESDKNLFVKELKSMKMYYHRPANELIFLTQFDHISLHKKGKPAWNKGVSPNEETRKKMSKSHKDIKPWNTNKSLSEEHRKNLSKSHIGKYKNLIWVNNDIKSKRIPKDQLQEYLDKGYKLGRNFNVIWVNNDIKSKRISKDQLQEYLDKGYKLGRKKWRK